MSEFKVGDTVRRAINFHNPEWVRFARENSNTIFTVTEVRGKWLSIDNYSVFGDSVPFAQRNFDAAAPDTCCNRSIVSSYHQSHLAWVMEQEDAGN